MDTDNPDAALDRIEAAMARIEAAAVRLRAGDAGLAQRHQRLREATVRALRQLDGLIAEPRQ